MTSLTIPDTAQAAPARTARRERLTFGGLLKSEWIKFWTVRATIWTLAVSTVVLVATVLLISLAIVNSPGDQNGGPPPTPLDPFTATVFLGPLAVAVLGALTITSEYSTGMIRASFSAQPRRLPVIWAKGIVLAVVVLVVSTATIALAAVLQWAIYQGKGFYVDASDPQVIRALFGNALYITAIALFAYAMGTLMRQSAAAIATVLGVLLVLPLLFGLIPWHVLNDIQPFLPNVAGSQITQTDAAIAESAHRNPGVPSLSAWQGFGVLLGYVVVVMAAGAWRVKTRDA
jgi:ABC-2 type transport system permease protein